MILNILIPFGSGTIIPNGFIKVILTHCMAFITKSIVNHVAISCISCPRMVFIEQRFFIFCKLSLDGNFWPDLVKFLDYRQKIRSWGKRSGPNSSMWVAVQQTGRSSRLGWSRNSKGFPNSIDLTKIRSISVKSLSLKRTMEYLKVGGRSGNQVSGPLDFLKTGRSFWFW